MFVNFLMARQGLCLTHLFWFVTASCLVWVLSRENAIQILLSWNFIEFKFYWCTHLFKNIYRTPTVCQGASKHFESGEKKNSNVNWLPTLSSVAMSFISFEFHKFLWVMRTPFYWWTSWGLEMLSNLWSGDAGFLKKQSYSRPRTGLLSARGHEGELAMVLTLLEKNPRYGNYFGDVTIHYLHLMEYEFHTWDSRKTRHILLIVSLFF